MSHMNSITSSISGSATVSAVSIPARRVASATPLSQRQLRQTNVLPSIQDTSDHNHVEDEERFMVAPDKIVKNGWLYKRSKRKEYKAREIISTADIMSVAMLTDQHKPNHFALFTSSNTYHLRADNTPDAQDWVDVIRSTANEAAESLLSSSFTKLSVLEGGSNRNIAGIASAPHSSNLYGDAEGGILFPRSFNTVPSIASPSGGSRSQYIDYSGTEDLAHSSNTSEIGLASTGFKKSSTPVTSGAEDSGVSGASGEVNGGAGGEATLRIKANGVEPDPVVEGDAGTVGDQMQGGPPAVYEDKNERIIEQGYLLRLKKRYNQWRRKYVVLTNKRLLFYKSPLQPKPTKALDVMSLIDVMEIDALSKSKQFCMQVITPEKRMRFCADNEEDLTKWLACLKSVIVSHEQLI